MGLCYAGLIWKLKPYIDDNDRFRIVPVSFPESVVQQTIINVPINLTKRKPNLLPH